MIMRITGHLGEDCFSCGNKINYSNNDLKNFALKIEKKSKVFCDECKKGLMKISKEDWE